MADAKITIPRAIGFSVISTLVGCIITATWSARGMYAELQAVREAAASLTVEQRATSARVNIMENKMSAYDVQFAYIIEALRRQETRSGYTPPPAPAAGN